MLHGRRRHEQCQACIVLCFLGIGEVGFPQARQLYAYLRGLAVADDLGEPHTLIDAEKGRSEKT